MSMLNASIVAVLVLIFASCGTEIRETERKSSPNARLELVTVESLSGGAAGSLTVTVHMVPKGGKPKGDESTLFAAHHVKDLRMEWIDDRNAIISVDPRTNILHFTNFWYPPPPSYVKDRISIQLRMK